MRWFVPEIPEVGDIRIRRIFAWLPMFIPEKRNCVWLEWVTVEERFQWCGVTEPQLRWCVTREIPQ